MAGYTFHQNGFGPAPYLVVRDAAGAPLWDGAVPLTDAAAGSPYGIQGVPGTDIGLQLLLRNEPDGTGVVLILPYRVIGTNPDGTPIPQNFAPLALAKGETGSRLGRRPQRRAPRRRRVHPADRQARPGPGPDLARLRAC